MKKIYLAGSCGKESRELMTNICQRLRDQDYEVYAPFELKIENAWDYSQEDWARLVYEKDIEAIKECDVFFMISRGRISSAGVNFEEGYARALNKYIIVLQYGTDIETSLMTYSAADVFVPCSEERWILNGSGLKTAMEAIERKPEEKHICPTVLT